jgi:hypothetical protein
MTGDMVPAVVFIVQVAATLFMTGVIWFVQVVHYPLFSHTRGMEFTDYEAAHSVLTTRVVAPPMAIEAACAVLMVWFRPAGAVAWQVWAGLALLAVIWLSTAFVQVPCHEALARGFDARVHRRLVRTNWVRTIAWSLRALLVLWWVRIAIVA